MNVRAGSEEGGAEVVGVLASVSGAGGRPGIVAPAGSREAVAAALAAGADVVYVGLAGWSRGGSLAGLPAGDLAACAAMVRGSGARLYLALNVVPDLRALEVFWEKLAGWVALGVDGLILNDYGLLREVRRRHPGLGLTASVGCGALNREDLLFLAAAGADTVVLPPGISPEEVAAVAGEGMGPAVEAFARGVKEPFMLGRCWLAGYLRRVRVLREARTLYPGSARRGGTCGRPCRAEWDWGGLAAGPLPEEEVTVYHRLTDYVAAGVRYFKIQGRDLPPDRVRGLVEELRTELERLDHGGATYAGRYP